MSASTSLLLAEMNPKTGRPRAGARGGTIYAIECRDPSEIAMILTRITERLTRLEDQIAQTQLQKGKKSAAV